MAVPQMFDAISHRYDFINKVLSLGLDKVWRRSLIQHILPHNSRLRLLDLATGTGDLLHTILDKCPHIYDSIGLDPAEKMLEIARAKLLKYSHKCRLISGFAEMIPFPDHTFDIATCSFGIRNVASLSKSLLELHRTLVPGGRLLILEFSHPTNPLIRFLHRHYLEKFVPFVGKLLSNHREAYHYLSSTIELFPQGKALAERMHDAGFAHVKIQPLTCGIVSLYIGDKR
jgi:demethylmenaquinone methyltransferase/2-methoxy-6-polyprenyl-1,4-benzoquinol methylase